MQIIHVGSNQSIGFRTQQGETYGQNTKCKVHFKVSLRKPFFETLKIIKSCNLRVFGPNFVRPNLCLFYSNRFLQLCLICSQLFSTCLIFASYFLTCFHRFFLHHVSKIFSTFFYFFIFYGQGPSLSLKKYFIKKAGNPQSYASIQALTNRLV